MVTKSHIQRIKRAVRSKSFRLTTHTERERESDAVFVVEIEEAFGSEGVEVLEQYPDDPRGLSGLFLGFSKSGNPLHAVIGLSDPDMVIFITLYRPDPTLWYDWRKRA